jgi:hypothetical protein
MMRLTLILLTLLNNKCDFPTNREHILVMMLTIFIRFPLNENKSPLGA